MRDFLNSTLFNLLYYSMANLVLMLMLFKATSPQPQMMNPRFITMMSQSQTRIWVFEKTAANTVNKSRSIGKKNDDGFLRKAWGYPDCDAGALKDCYCEVVHKNLPAPANANPLHP